MVNKPFCLQCNGICSTIYAMILTQCTTESAEETERFAEKFAQTLAGGETLLLEGELGAGKTHFVKGLAKGLGVDDTVTSPTFALHNVYFGRLTLNHFDFYRIESSEEVVVIGLDELFRQSDAVAAIEWSERVADLLPAFCITVKIEKISDSARRITVTK